MKEHAALNVHEREIEHVDAIRRLLLKLRKVDMPCSSPDCRGRATRVLTGEYGVRVVCGACSGAEARLDREIARQRAERARGRRGR